MLYIIRNTIDGSVYCTNGNKTIAFEEEEEATEFIDDQCIDDAEPYLDVFLQDGNNVELQLK